MNVTCAEEMVVARIAAAIGEPARTRILYSLLDGYARTSTELAIVAEVGASTASVHLNRLREEGLIKVLVQGKHRYYSLAGRDVAAALESLSALAGGSRKTFVPNTPSRLRFARTCYDHIAGTLGVALHDRCKESDWIVEADGVYDVSPQGTKAFESLGINIAVARSLRRQFAFGCLDWSERRPHIGGSLGAALLETAVKKNWVERDLDSRALSLTSAGKREMRNRFGVEV